MLREDMMTVSQTELLPKMTNFLQGPDKFFLLTGKPGTGKSTITEYILSEYLKADKNNSSSLSMNVAGITLAHAAKKVLGQFIPHVFTFAKAYGLKESFDERTGKKTFVFDDRNKDPIIGIQPIPVFVHDEVSIYNETMLNIVMNNTSMYSKVIFIGDRAQLPPIRDDEDDMNGLGRDMDSPIFQMEFPDHCKHELTEVVRQDEKNSIRKLTDLIRQEIFGLQRINLVMEAILQPDMVDGEGYGHVTTKGLLQHYEKEFERETRVIGYRNKTPEKFNPMIRNFIRNNPQNMLVEGDLVCMNDSFYEFNEEGYPINALYNSDVFRIEKIHTSNIRLTANKRRYYINSYVANLEGEPGRIIIPTEEGQHVHDEVLADLLKKCKSYEIKWPEYYKFKQSFCNASYAHAITAYKSQGSTYRRVYVDVNDILNTKPISRKRKLQTLYTAITRAQFDCWFIDVHLWKR